MTRHTARTVIDGREYLVINWSAYYPLDVFTVEEALEDYNLSLLENFSNF